MLAVHLACPSESSNPLLVAIRSIYPLNPPSQRVLPRTNNPQGKLFELTCIGAHGILLGANEENYKPL